MIGVCLLTSKRKMLTYWQTSFLVNIYKTDGLMNYSCKWFVYNNIAFWYINQTCLGWLTFGFFFSFLTVTPNESTKMSQTFVLEKKELKDFQDDKNVLLSNEPGDLSPTLFFDHFSSAHELFLLTQGAQEREESSGLIIRVNFLGESDVIKKKIETLINYVHQHITTALHGNEQVI